MSNEGLPAVLLRLMSGCILLSTAALLTSWFFFREDLGLSSSSLNAGRDVASEDTSESHHKFELLAPQTLELDCRSSEVTVTRSKMIRLVGNFTCGTGNAKLTLVDIHDLTAKSQVNIFSLPKNRFSTDYFKLTPGENKFKIRTAQSDGGYSYRVVRVVYH